MPALDQLNILHVLIPLFFGFLTVCLFVQIILSWFPIPPSNPFVRFFNGVTAPVLGPVRRRIPSLSVGIFDIGYTIAFLLTWWALGIIAGLLLQALPRAW